MRCNNAVQKSPVAWEAFELGKRAGLFFASYYVAIEALKGQRAPKGQAQPTHGSVMAASQISLSGPRGTPRAKKSLKTPGRTGGFGIMAFSSQ